MPKLPSLLSLGDRPTPSGGYNVSLASQSEDGEELKTFGRALGGVSKALYKREEYEKQKEIEDLKNRASRQSAYAGLSFTKRIMDFEKAKKDDPYYDKHEAEYEEFVSKNIEELAQTIEDDSERETFRLRASSSALDGLGRIRSSVREKHKDAEILQSNVASALAKESFLNAPDDKTREDVIQNFSKAINSNQFLSETDKWAAQRKWLADTREAWIESLPATERVKLLEGVAESRKTVLNPNVPKDFGESVDFLLTRIEGDRFVENDGGRGPSKYGVVGSQNGLTPEQVRNLTPEQAKAIYKREYWDKIGADNLPENIRLVAFDTAVNFGPATAKRMLKQSGGDPAAMIELRRGLHDEIANQKPDTHGQYKEGWQNRNSLLESTIYKDVITAKDKDTFGIPTDRINVLLDKARKDVETEKKAAEQQKILDMEADIDTKLENEKKIRATIDNPDKTVMQKVNEINKMEMLGQIRDKSAVEFRRYLESVEKLTAESEPNLEASIIQRVYDVAAMSEENPKEFLRGLGNIQNEMLSYRADGRLSAQSESRLKKQITSLTSGKKSEAAKILGFSLSEARKTLDTLPPEYRLQATRELIQSIDVAEIKPPSPDMSTKERKEYNANLKLLYKTKSLELVDKYKTGMRTKAIETVEKVKTGQPVETKKDHSSLWK